MRKLALFQNSIIDGFEGGNVAGNRNQPSWPGTPDTPADRPSSSDFDDKVDTLPPIQLLSFLIPSIDVGVIDSLDSVDVLIPDEGLQQSLCPVQLGLRRRGQDDFRSSNQSDLLSASVRDPLEDPLEQHIARLLQFLDTIQSDQIAI